MAPPVPRTYVAAEFVTASILNGDIRDIHNYLIGTKADADVVTAETTTSTGFVDLATTGPSITGVNLVVGQPVSVVVSARIANSAGNECLMSFAVSVAETDAASDNDAARNVGTNDLTIQRETIYIPGTAGSHTFTAKYRVTAGTGTFRFRRITIKTP